MAPNNNVIFYKLKVFANHSVGTKNKLVNSFGLCPKEPEGPSVQRKTNEYFELLGKITGGKEVLVFLQIPLMVSI